MSGQPARPRDVDRLDALPDERIKEEDKRYLQRHGIDQLLSEVMRKLLETSPPDPVQYIIDCLSLEPEVAYQDEKTGLSIYRKRKLMELFRVFDKQGTGKVSFRMLQEYNDKYGGTTLSYAELSSIFKDFQSGSDDVTLAEFLMFFSKISRTKTNKEFGEMVTEMATWGEALHTAGFLKMMLPIMGFGSVTIAALKMDIQGLWLLSWSNENATSCLVLQMSQQLQQHGFGDCLALICHPLGFSGGKQWH